MPAQYWMAGVPPFGIADGAAVTATTLTELSPVPQIIIPYPMLQEYAGKRFEVQAGGHFTTNATAATATFGLYLGTPGAIGSMGTAIATSAAFTLVASQTNRFWRIEGNVQVRTTGSSGTVISICEISNMSAAGTDMVFTAAGSTVTVDTTAAKAFALGITVSTAQSVTCRYFGIRSVN